MHRKTLRLIAAVMVALLAGCASKMDTLDYADDASATAVIEFPQYIELRALDGEARSQPFTVSYPYQLKVAAGVHVIGFQYQQEWGAGASSRYYKSPIMQLTFTARAGERYVIDYPKPAYIDRLNEGENYAKTFSAWLLTPGGEKIPAKAQPKGPGILARLIGGGAVATDSVPTPDSPAAAGPVSRPGEARVESARLDALQTLWKDASEDERKAFMNWLISGQ